MVLFSEGQDWDTNHRINYQLINSWGVIVCIRAVALRTTGIDLLGVRFGFISFLLNKI